MEHIILKDKIIIRANNHCSQFTIRKLNELLNDPILQYLTMEDLLKIWKDTFGIPSNIKDFLLKKCELHDKSSAVNSFIYKDKEYWFDKNTRNSLLSLTSCSEKILSLLLDDVLVELDLNIAKKFLLDLELYASKCYINTQKHIKAIKELKTLEDLINYDYTKGYPEKITLNE